MSQNGVSHRCACVKLSTKGCIAPFWGADNLPEEVSRDMGYRSDSIAISHDMGPLSPTHPYTHTHPSGQTSQRRRGPELALGARSRCLSYQAHLNSKHGRYGMTDQANRESEKNLRATTNSALFQTSPEFSHFFRALPKLFPRIFA